MQLRTELVDGPQRIPSKHMLHDADTAIIPKRKVDVLAGYEIDGHGRANRTLHGHGE